MSNEAETRAQLIRERDELRGQLETIQAQLESLLRRQRELEALAQGAAHNQPGQSLREQVNILETLHNLGQVLAVELDLQQLVQVVTDAATELTRAEFGAFFYNVLDEHGESYTLYTLSGVTREAFSRFPMPRNTHLFGPTFRGEGTVRIDDVHKDPRFGKNDPYFGMPDGHLPVTSYLAVPVVSRAKEVLGGLFFGHSSPGIFTERDEKIIEGLAGQAAIAIDNARLYQESRDQQERLRITLDSIGDAVIATDAGGRVNFMNPVAQALTGWTEKEARDKPLEDVFRIVNEFSREAAESPVARVLREGAVVGLANHTLLLSRDGREIPIDDSGAPIRNSEGKLIGVILVFRDITERRQSEGRINLLLELSAAFSQALTSNQIAEVVVNQALNALGARVGAVSVLVEQGTMMELLNLHGLSPAAIEQYRRTPLDYPGPLNDAARTGKIIWIDALDEYLARYPHFAETIKNNKTQSTIALPLKVNERVIGGFSLSFPFKKPYNVAEEAFFTALAQQCAQSLERARLYEEEQKARTVAEALREIVVALTSTLELSEVFDKILNSIDRVVLHDIADIMLVENGSANVVRSHRYAQFGIVASEDAMQHFSLTIADIPQLHWVLQNKKAAIIHDTRVDQRWIKQYEPDLIRSSITVPVLIADQVIGFLNVNSLTPNVYTAEQAERLQVFADQAAVAIKNAQLHQRGLELAALEERQRIARDLHDAVSQTLFSANLIAESLPRLWPDESEKALERIHQLHQLTRGAAAEMRTLLMELRPAMLANSLLSELMNQLCDAIRGRSIIRVLSDLHLTEQESLPTDVRIAFYRIAQESLNNAIKHARASEIALRVNSSAGNIEMVIKDDGGGFDQSEITPGIGLHSMQERAEKIGATYTIASAKGQGTTITVTWSDSEPTGD